MNKISHPGRVIRNLKSVRPPVGIGVLEWFLMIQLLASGLVLVPGLNQYRIVFRTLPYLVSLGLLCWPAATKQTVGKSSASFHWLAVSLGILGLGAVLHPFSILGAGIGQCIYQLSIAAPVFWTRRFPIDPPRLYRLIWILFLCSAISSAVGALQTYFPDTFMPKEFSSGFGDDYLASMTYEGANGNIITRPPGLTDLPGGAATAAVITAFLGVVLMTGPITKFWQRILCGSLTLVGLFVLYLTQVRSYFIDLVVIILIVVVFRLKNKRVGSVIYLASFATVFLFAAFMWAVSVGGGEVSERFTGLVQQGVLESYEQNRGSFVADTFQVYLPHYPLGAGVGRWGIINIYFGQDSMIAPLYAEIQITGWAFDGGWPLLITSLGAIALALVGVVKIAWCARQDRWELAAQAILCVNLLVALQAFAGPAFNTQLGTLFWFLTAALHQAAYGGRLRPGKANPSLRQVPAVPKSLALADAPASGLSPSLG